MEFKLTLKSSSDKTVNAVNRESIGLDEVDRIRKFYRLPIPIKDICDERGLSTARSYDVIITDEEFIKKSGKFNSILTHTVIVPAFFLKKYTVIKTQLYTPWDILPLWYLNEFCSFRHPFGKKKTIVIITYEILNNMILKDWKKLGYPDSIL